MSAHVATHPYISLCSGAGQLDNGLIGAWPEARPICYVEREFTAALVLGARMRDGCLPDAPIWSDVKSFDAGAWRGSVEGVVGGIPCQPHSVAGKQLRDADPRDLWPDAERIIRDTGAAWCFLENVAGALPDVYARWIPALQSMGFTVACGLYTAEEAGAPHLRERVFLLAHRDKGGWQWLPAGGVHAGDDADGRGGTVADAEGASGRAFAASRGGVVDDAFGQRGRGGDAGREHAADAFAPSAGVRPPFPPGPNDRDAWGRVLERWPDLAPAVESEVQRVAHGVGAGVDLPRVAQLRLVGNGVVPQTAAIAFRDLAAQLGWAS